MSDRNNRFVQPGGRRGKPNLTQARKKYGLSETLNRYVSKSLNSRKNRGADSSSIYNTPKLDKKQASKPVNNQSAFNNIMTKFKDNLIVKGSGSNKPVKAYSFEQPKTVRGGRLYLTGSKHDAEKKKQYEYDMKARDVALNGKKSNFKRVKSAIDGKVRYYDKLVYNPVDNSYLNTVTNREMPLEQGVLQLCKEADETGVMDEQLQKSLERGKLILQGYYCVDKDDMKSWFKDSFYYTTVYTTDEKGNPCYAKVPMLKANAKMPEYAFGMSQYRDWYDKWVTKDKNGKSYVKAGAPEAPVYFDLETGEVGKNSTYDAAFEEQLKRDWEVTKIVQEYHNSETLKLTKRMRMTAGWDANAKDSFLDIARAAIKSNGSGDSVSKVASGILKDTKEYLSTYLFNPLRSGDSATAFMNGLVNFDETTDAAAVGTRAIASSRVNLKYSGNHLYDTQKDWVYSGGSKNQKELMELGAGILLGENSSKVIGNTHRGNVEREREKEKQFIEKKIKKAGLWDEYKTLKSEWSSVDKYDDVKGRFVKAYTTTENYDVHSGSGLRNMATYVLTDPLTYATLGTGALAKTGSKAAAKKAIKSTYKDMLKTDVNKELLNARMRQDIQALSRGVAQARLGSGAPTLNNMSRFKFSPKAVNPVIPKEYIEKYAAQSAGKLVEDNLIPESAYKSYVNKYIASVNDMQASGAFKVAYSMNRASAMVNKLDGTLLAGGLYLPYATIKTVKLTKKVLSKAGRKIKLLKEIPFKNHQNAKALFESINNGSEKSAIVDLPAFLEELQNTSFLDHNGTFNTAAFREYKKGLLKAEGEYSKLINNFIDSKQDYRTRLGMLNSGIRRITGSKVGSTYAKDTENLQQALLDIADNVSYLMKDNSVIYSEVKKSIDNMIALTERGFDAISAVERERIKNSVSGLKKIHTLEELKDAYMVHLQDRLTLNSEAFDIAWRKRFKELVEAEGKNLEVEDEMALLREHYDKQVNYQFDPLPTKGADIVVPKYMPDTQKEVLDAVDNIKNFIESIDVSKEEDAYVKLLINDPQLKTLQSYLKNTDVSDMVLTDLMKHIQNTKASIEFTYRFNLHGVPRLDAIKSGDLSGAHMYKDDKELLKDMYEHKVYDYYYLTHRDKNTYYDMSTLTIEEQNMLRAKQNEPVPNPLYLAGDKSVPKEILPKDLDKQLKEIQAELKDTYYDKDNKVTYYDLYKDMCKEISMWDKGKLHSDKAVATLNAALHTIEGVVSFAHSRASKTAVLNVSNYKQYKLLTTDPRFSDAFIAIADEKQPVGNLIKNRDRLLELIDENAIDDNSAIHKLYRALTTLDEQSTTLAAFTHFTESINSLALPEYIKDVIIDYCFGIGRNKAASYFQTRSRNMTEFVSGIRKAIYSQLPKGHLYLSDFRDTICRRSHEDVEVFLEAHRDEIKENADTLNEMFSNAGGANALRDVKAQMFQYIERDSKVIKELNKISETQDIYFLNFETMGKNVDTDKITRIAMKKYEAIEEGTSLADTLRIIDDSATSFDESVRLDSKELEHNLTDNFLRDYFSSDDTVSEFASREVMSALYKARYGVSEGGEVISEADILKKLVDLIDETKKRTGKTPMFYVHGGSNFDIAYLLKRYKLYDDLTSETVGDVRAAFKHNKKTFNELLKYEKQQLVLDSSMEREIADALSSLAHNLPDGSYMRFFDTNKFADAYNEVFDSIASSSADKIHRSLINVPNIEKFEFFNIKDVEDMLEHKSKFWVDMPTDYTADKVFIREHINQLEAEDIAENRWFGDERRDVIGEYHRSKDNRFYRTDPIDELAKLEGTVEDWLKSHPQPVAPAVAYERKLDIRTGTYLTPRQSTETHLRTCFENYNKEAWHRARYNKRMNDNDYLLHYVKEKMSNLHPVEAEEIHIKMLKEKGVSDVELRKAEERLAKYKDEKYKDATYDYYNNRNINEINSTVLEDYFMKEGSEVLEYESAEDAINYLDEMRAAQKELYKEALETPSYKEVENLEFDGVDVGELYNKIKAYESKVEAFKDKYSRSSVAGFEIWKKKAKDTRTPEVLSNKAYNQLKSKILKQGDYKVTAAEQYYKDTVDKASKPPLYYIYHNYLERPNDATRAILKEQLSVLEKCLPYEMYDTLEKFINLEDWLSWKSEPILDRKLAVVRKSLMRQFDELFSSVPEDLYRGLGVLDNKVSNVIEQTKSLYAYLNRLENINTDNVVTEMWRGNELDSGVEHVVEPEPITKSFVPFAGIVDVYNSLDEALKKVASYGFDTEKGRYFVKLSSGSKDVLDGFVDILNKINSSDMSTELPSSVRSCAEALYKTIQLCQIVPDELISGMELEALIKTVYSFKDNIAGFYNRAVGEEITYRHVKNELEMLNQHLGNTYHNLVEVFLNINKKFQEGVISEHPFITDSINSAKEWMILNGDFALQMELLQKEVTDASKLHSSSCINVEGFDGIGIYNSRYGASSGFSDLQKEEIYNMNVQEHAPEYVMHQISDTSITGNYFHLDAERTDWRTVYYDTSVKNWFTENAEDAATHDNFIKRQNELNEEYEKVKAEVDRLKGKLEYADKEIEALPEWIAYKEESGYNELMAEFSEALHMLHKTDYYRFKNLPNSEYAKDIFEIRSTKKPYSIYEEEQKAVVEIANKELDRSRLKNVRQPKKSRKDLDAVIAKLEKEIEQLKKKYPYRNEGREYKYYAYPDKVKEYYNSIVLYANRMYEKNRSVLLDNHTSRIRNVLASKQMKCLDLEKEIKALDREHKMFVQKVSSKSKALNIEEYLELRKKMSSSSWQDMPKHIKEKDELRLKELERNSNRFSTGVVGKTDKISMTEHESMLTFSKIVSNKVNNHIKSTTLIDAYKTAWIQIIEETIQYARKLESTNPLHFFAYLKVPSTAREAFAMADVIYNRCYRDYSTLVNTLQANVEKHINSISFKNREAVQAFTKLGYTDPLIGIDPDAIKILQGDGLDLIYKKQHSYLSSTYYTREIFDGLSIEANIDSIIQKQKSRRGWAERFATSEKSVRDVAFEELENSQLEMLELMKEVRTEHPELAGSCREFLNGLKADMRQAHSLQVLDYITKSEENLVTHLLFHNQLLVVAIDGSDVYRKYIAKLDKLLASNPEHIVSVQKDEQIWIGLKNDKGICIQGDSKYVEGGTKMSFVDETKAYDMASMNEHYRDVGFILSDKNTPLEKYIPEGVDKELAAQYLTRFREYVSTCYSRLNYLSDGAIRGSMVTPYDLNKHQALYRAAPEEFLSQALQESSTFDQRLFHTSQYDFTVIGEEGKCTKQAAYNDTDIFQDIKHCYDDLEGTVSTERLYISNFFSGDSHCKFKDIFKDHNAEDTLNILKGNPDQCVVTLVTNKHTQSGFSVKKLKIEDKLSLEIAEEYDAIVVPYDLYVEMVRIINTSTFDKTYLKVWSKILFVLKVGHLCNPGTWFRNWVDATIKATGEAGDFGAVAVGQLNALNLLLQYNKLIRYVRREDGIFEGTASVISSRWEKYQGAAKVNITKEQFDFIESWLRVSLSGGESKMLTELLNKQKYDVYSSANLKRGSTRTTKDKLDLANNPWDYVGSDLTRFEQLDEDDIAELIEYGLRKNKDVFPKDFTADEFWDVFRGRRDGVIKDMDKVLYDKYKTSATNILTIRNKKRLRGAERVGSQFDYFASFCLKPMSKVEQVVRLGQFLTMENKGYTRSEIFKSIADSQFEYELKSTKMKYAELAITYCNFEYNNMAYWCRMLENDPAFVYMLGRMWDTLSWEAAQDCYEDEDVFSNQSIAYMMRNGALPIGEKGLYLKMYPSALGALNWFYGMPSQYMTAVIPPVEIISKEMLYLMGGHYAELLDNLDYSYKDQKEWEKLLGLVPIAGTMYTRYYQHITERQPWTRIVDSTPAKLLAGFNPSMFGAVYLYNRRKSDDFDEFQKRLAKQGKWYDCNIDRVVDISRRNTDGLNDPDLDFKEREKYMFIWHGKLWNSNWLGFEDGKKKFGHFTEFVGNIYTDERGHTIGVGLNREFNFNKPGEWDRFLYLKEKLHGVKWCNNAHGFIPKNEWKKERLNRTDLSVEEFFRYMEEDGYYWDYVDKKFKRVPENIQGPDRGYYGYGYRNFRRWVNYGRNYPSRRSKPKNYRPYGGNVLSTNNLTYGKAYTSAHGYSNIRMAMSGYKDYDDYYRKEYNFNYRNRTANPLTAVKRYNPIIRYHIPVS